MRRDTAAPIAYLQGHLVDVVAVGIRGRLEVRAGHKIQFAVIAAGGIAQPRHAEARRVRSTGAESQHVAVGVDCFDSNRDRREHFVLRVVHGDGLPGDRLAEVLDHRRHVVVPRIVQHGDGEGLRRDTAAPIAYLQGHLVDVVAVGIRGRLEVRAGHKIQFAVIAAGGIAQPRHAEARRVRSTGAESQHVAVGVDCFDSNRDRREHFVLRVVHGDGLPGDGLTEVLDHRREISRFEHRRARIADHAVGSEVGVPTLAVHQVERDALADLLRSSDAVEREVVPVRRHASGLRAEFVILVDLRAHGQQERHFRGSAGGHSANFEFK